MPVVHRIKTTAKNAESHRLGAGGWGLELKNCIVANAVSGPPRHPPFPKIRRFVIAAVPTQQSLFDSEPAPWELDDLSQQLIATVVLPGGPPGEFDYVVPDEFHGVTA